MPCLLVLVALVSPRLALVLLAIFSDRISESFSGVLLPLAGFFLLPWTTLLYVLAWSPSEGVQTIGWVFVAFGALLDLSGWGFGPRTARSRR